MKHILAAVDLSEITEDVTAVASGFARAFSAKLGLLHAAAPDPEFVGYEAGPQTVRDARAHELRAEHRELERRASSLKEDGIDARPMLVMGPTVEVILGEAKKLEADLIVIGSHGHGALYHALVGNVTDEILRHAPCPVCVVPAAEKDTDTP